MVHPTYGAVKLPKINKETNLWQFRSTTAAKSRENEKESEGARGRETEKAGERGGCRRQRRKRGELAGTFVREKF